MGTITHAHQTAIANDPTKDVSANVWNAGHAFSLTAADVGLSSVVNAVYRSPLSADTTKNVPADFATLDLALQYAAAIDFGGHTLTIQLANGTYSPAGNSYNIPATVGQALPRNLIIQGNTTTPTNVVLTSAANFSGIVEVGSGARCRIQGVQFVGIGGNAMGIHATSAGFCEIQAVDFGGGMYFQRFSESGGQIQSFGNYSISGSAQSHIGAGGGGFSYDSPVTTVTLTGTPNFALCYLIASDASFAREDGTAFSGSATGQRYIAQKFGIINVNGAGATYLPGNAPGDATGGIYG